MATCCGRPVPEPEPGDPCAAPPGLRIVAAPVTEDPAASPIHWFREMVDRALAHASEARAQRRPVVGIACEYTPREMILAAGGVPVCLCGGAADTVAPAEEHLPANLCPLIKSTYGYSLTGTNPFLSLMDLIVAETTCDGKKKMYELLGRRHPMHVMELPQRLDGQEGLELWVAELRRLRGALEERFHVSITDEALNGAIRTMNRERRLRRGVADLMRADSPPLSGREVLEMKSLVPAIPGDLDQYERAIATLDQRVSGRPSGRRVRVLLTGVPLPHGAERVVELIEECGGLVVAQENCTGLKPILDDVAEDTADPLRAIAEKYLHLPCSVMTPNTGRRDLLARLAREFKADCVIELIWQACLTYDVESFLIREFCEQEIQLPYLRIVTDYSPSDSARISLRVQALFETVR